MRARALVEQFAPAGPVLVGKAGIDALGDRAVLVDCRTDAEREVSIIPGAVARGAFEAAGGARAALAAGKTVVPYCTIGYRSGNYALELARAHPALEVRNGEGIVPWALDGGALVRPADGARASRLHAWGPQFGVVPDGVEAVFFDRRGEAGAVLGVVRDALRRTWGRCAAALGFGIGR
jgi:rhodanese-related sulfurtransferase